MKEDAKYDLEERLLDFSVEVIRLANSLDSSIAGLHVAKQFLRSGTSALPNHAEAQAAESRRDFIHKMKICLKELRETRRWIMLIDRVPLNKAPDQTNRMLGETEELIRIFSASIRTAETRTPPNSHRSKAKPTK